jgi:prepilin-type N-terminal cleavage/methylation domain-containing protein
MSRRSGGYTLIELMVVMAIAGMLALLAVPLLGHQRQRSADAAMSADLRRVASLMEVYFTDTSAYSDDLTVSGARASVASGYSTYVSADNSFAVTVPARLGSIMTFCLVASRRAGASSGTQNWVWINDAGGLQPAGVTTCS